MQLVSDIQCTPSTDHARAEASGFTLIELSIVLVIIGLIVGGVMVGRDLISAAVVRAQLSQIEEIKVNVSTFRVKYLYLPGDIPDPDASRFGFTARQNLPKNGNGNGVLEAEDAFGNPCYNCIIAGEFGQFWSDLSHAKLVKGVFDHYTCCLTDPVYASDLKKLFPQAVINNNMGSGAAFIYAWADIATNYLGLSVINSVNETTFSDYRNNLTPKQAFAIDSKIDDGLPLSGVVIAVVAADNWPDTYLFPDGVLFLNTTFSAITASTIAESTTTCFDNSSSAANTLKYSLILGSNYANCSLSFKLKN